MHSVICRKVVFIRTPFTPVGHPMHAVQCCSRDPTQLNATSSAAARGVLAMLSNQSHPRDVKRTGISPKQIFALSHVTPADLRAAVVSRDSCTTNGVRKIPAPPGASVG